VQEVKDGEDHGRQRILTGGMRPDGWNALCGRAAATDTCVKRTELSWQQIHLRFRVRL
jgi:hypothetical protein